MRSFHAALAHPYLAHPWQLSVLPQPAAPRLPAFAARYRLLFIPIRYTSMGLALIEAMMAGAPVVGLATTGMAMAIENGRKGYVDTRLDVLAARMKELLLDKVRARQLGTEARRLPCGVLILPVLWMTGMQPCS